MVRTLGSISEDPYGYEIEESWGDGATDDATAQAIWLLEDMTKRLTDEVLTQQKNKSANEIIYTRNRVGGELWQKLWGSGKNAQTNKFHRQGIVGECLEAVEHMKTLLADLKPFMRDRWQLGVKFTPQEHQKLRYLLEGARKMCYLYTDKFKPFFQELTDAFYREREAELKYKEDGRRGEQSRR